MMFCKEHPTEEASLFCFTCERKNILCIECLMRG